MARIRTTAPTPMYMRFLLTLDHFFCAAYPFVPARKP